ncbi:MAG: sialidase family protein [Acidobacteria bacterium]|nr:sialidase family protein [Acidobacteriota bacterium]
MLLAFAALLLLAAPAPPGVVIDHQSKDTGQYIGSPSIAILPNGDYVASHDLFGPGATHLTSAVTRVFRSTDRGLTWKKTAEFNEQFWSNLFVHRKVLYLMGTTGEYGRIVIRRSTDGGATWGSPAYLTSDGFYHTAPMPMVEKDGRLWRAMERHPPGTWGGFQAFLISAPLKADLMAAGSWTMTPKLDFPADATEGHHWLEGNAVVAPDGSLLDVLRVDNIEKAAIVKLEKQGLVWTEMVPFPGGAKKFSIRFDRRSKKYWTLANQALPEYSQSATTPASVRNTLVMMSSSDVRTWKVERTVLHHPDPLKHAFQYVDWQFDGNDLIVASRTAFDDETGGAHNAHDANFLTFHRVENFRKSQ